MFIKYNTELDRLIAHNVPRFIKHIKEDRGIPTEKEWEWLKSMEVEDLIQKADEKILFPKNEEVFRESLFIIVRAIAIMSFIPNGIYIFDFHFNAQDL